jgi:hypothetical protein
VKHVGWALLLAATLIVALAVSYWVVLIPLFVWLLFKAILEDLKER